MLIKSVRGFTPQYGKNCFFAENATVIGDVILGDEVSVWYQAVIRGDVNAIRIGNKVNIQDGVVIHATFETAPTHIGNNVSIGHNAIVHGCTIEDNVLIGMGAIVLDNVHIDDDVILGAGALVPPNKHLPSGYLYVGSPAKAVRKLSEDELAFLKRSASHYVNLKNEYRQEI